MTDPESISLGGSLPQWMRMRPDVKHEDGAAFSPPAHDDSFFYIRYPIGQSGADKKPTAAGQLQSLTEALSDIQVKAGAGAPAATKTTTAGVQTTAKPQQFAKHTEPCKMFMTTTSENPAAPLPTFAHVKNQTKPFGTDDGFDGEGAACGTSIVRVARQMVSGKSLSRGFTVANFAGDLEAHPEHHPSDDQYHQLYPAVIEAAEQQRYMSHTRNQQRRGSKSLPASPLGSPKSMRKAQPNPYFCGTGFGGFGVSGSNASSTGAATSGAGLPGSVAASTPAAAAASHGWFLSGLLGYQRGEISSSTHSVVSNISEEVDEGHDVLLHGSVSGAGGSGGAGGAAGGTVSTAAASGSGGTTTAKSTAVPNTATGGSGPGGSSFLQPKKLLKAKPSELREMNFWSPTSM